LQLPRQIDRSTGGLTDSSLRIQSRDDDDVLGGSLIPVAAGNNHLTTVRRRAFPGYAQADLADRRPGGISAMPKTVARHGLDTTSADELRQMSISPLA
jgi:hypothetical protein